jgi:hypothetical protein
MARISGSDSSRASTICEKPTSARNFAFLRRADVGLGRGMQLDRRQVKLQQAHVLHDQRIRPGLVHLPGQAARRLDFVVVENRVEGDEDPGVEAVRVGRQALDVGHRVAGVVARAEGRPADIHGVGAMPDRLDGDFGIPRGGEEFKGTASASRYRLSAGQILDLAREGVPLAVLDHLVAAERRRILEDMAGELNRRDQACRERIELEVAACRAQSMAPPLVPHPMPNCFPLGPGSPYWRCM